MTAPPPPYADDFLPRFDLETRHTTEIEAPAERVYEVTRSLDLSSSWIVRTLFRLRGLPTRSLTLDGLARNRFLPLLDDPPHGFVLGLIGQFWRLSGRLKEFDPDTFVGLDTPDDAKAIWTFDLEATTPTTTRLRTVTRVLCPDAASRRRFRAYWSVVGPFSGLVRRELLRVVKKQSEAAA